MRRRARALAVVAVLPLVGLVAATFHAWRERGARERTIAYLEWLRDPVAFAVEHPHLGFSPDPGRPLYLRQMTVAYLNLSTTPSRHSLHDGWGRLLILRRPGPLHPKGWDLYSCGPNGVDEQGEGDDIIVGGDIASVGS